jgi:hypothetical protein
MARKFSGYHEDGVDADVVARPCVARCKSLSRNGDAAESIFVERQSGGVFTIALLNLDEGNHLSAPCHQVDFATRNSCAPRQDSPAAQPQPPRGNGFRAPSTGFRNVTVQALPANSKALA